MRTLKDAQGLHPTLILPVSMPRSQGWQQSLVGVEEGAARNHPKENGR